MKTRVLLMDDEVDLVTPLALGLERRGYFCHSVSDIQAGLEALKNSTFDLIVSDVRMPGGGAIEMLRMIRDENGKPPPVLLITGLLDVDLAEAFTIGVHGVLKKPFDRNTLILAMERILKPIEQRWLPLSEIPSSAIVMNPQWDSDSLETLLGKGHVKMGHGGISLCVQNPPPPGEMAVSIPVRLNSGHLSRMEGILRWVRENASGLEAGVELTAMDPAVKEVLLPYALKSQKNFFLPPPR